MLYDFIQIAPGELSLQLVHLHHNEKVLVIAGDRYGWDSTIWCIYRTSHKGKTYRASPSDIYKFDEFSVEGIPEEITD